MLEALESRRLFTVGAPDPSFGTDGIVTFPQLSEVRQIVRESDDSILAVTGQGLVHINADGVIDTSFGVNGVANPGFALSAVVIAPDGDLVVAGMEGNSAKVAAFTAGGALDNNFGTDGIVTLSPSGADQYESDDLVVQPDGKLVIGIGQIDTSSAPSVPGYNTLVMVQLNSDGSIDSSAYGTDGYVDIAYGTSPEAMTALPNDSTVVAAVFNPIGQEVNAGAEIVGPTGRVYTIAGGSAYFSAITNTQGDFLLANYPETFTYEQEVTRFLENGTIAPNFNNGTGEEHKPAYFFNGFETVTPMFFGMASEPDGGFILEYTTRNGNLTDGSVDTTTFPQTQLAFLRFNADGTRDTNFAPNGVTYVGLPSSAGTPVGNPVILSSGNILQAAMDSNDHLLLEQFQGSDSSSTNPTVSSIVFTLPAIGRRWAHVTVTFDQGNAPIEPSSVASLGLLVGNNTGYTTGLDDLHELANANLESVSGGDGSPLVASYVFAMPDPPLTRVDNGTYTFFLGSGVVADTDGQENTGELVGFSLYVPRHNRGVVSVLEAPVSDYYSA